MTRNHGKIQAVLACFSRARQHSLDSVPLRVLQPAWLAKRADEGNAMRYLVIGTSGAGKSSFAQKLAAAAQCTYIELDAFYWGPNWQAVSPGQFEQSVLKATETDRWVADGNYSAVRALLWPRATHVIWLNYGRFTVFSRVLWRTLSRGMVGARLSHGNRESLRMALCSRDSVLLWSLSTYAKNQTKFQRLRASGEFAHLQWTELSEPSQAGELIKRLAVSSAR